VALGMGLHLALGRLWGAWASRGSSQRSHAVARGHRRGATPSCRGQMTPGQEGGAHGHMAVQGRVAAPGRVVAQQNQLAGLPRALRLPAARWAHRGPLVPVVWVRPVHLPAGL